jgi:hypothetical protein
MRDQGRDDIIDAHIHSAAHRTELQQSTLAGCFFCCKVFDPKQIEHWVDDGECALCPTCGTDAVIGDASGFPVTDKRFLREMNRFWFC